MKSSTEYIEESETYAKNRLARFKEKFGDNYLECSDEDAIFLLKHGFMDAAMRYDYENYLLVEKACEWLEKWAYFSVNDLTGSLDEKDLVDRFRKAMKGW